MPYDGGEFPSLALTVRRRGGAWITIPTTDLRKVSIRRGRTREDQAVQTGTLTIVLENHSGDYDPDNALSPWWSDGYSVFAPGLEIRMTGTWGGTSYILFSGTMESIEVDLGEDPVATLVWVDALAWLSHRILPEIIPSYAGDMTSTRLGRILTAAGWTGTTSISGARTMLDTTYDDNALSLAEEVARCEAGRLWVKRDGVLTLTPYEDRYLVDVSMEFSDDSPSYLPFDSLKVSTGAKYIINHATVNTGPGEYTASNTDSVARFGAMHVDWEAPLNVAGAAQALAQILADRRAWPMTRLDNIAVGAANLSSLWHKLLAAELGQKIKLTRTPVDGRTRTFFGIVEGLAHDISPDSWTLTLDMSPAQPAGGGGGGTGWFIINSSLLGGPHVLYY